MKYLPVLLVLVPISIVLDLIGASHTLVFLAAALAIVPLASLIGQGTEQLSSYTGPAVGGLLQVTLANAAELIITTMAIREGLLDLVKASIAGSILGNILLVMGASLLVGGLTNGRQYFNERLASLSSTMMALAAVSLVLPALFHHGPHSVSGNDLQHLSEGVALALLLLYGLYVYFTIFHERQQPGESAHSGEDPHWSRRRAIGTLVGATLAIVAVSEVLVSNVEPVVVSWGISEFFLGVILVPIIGNAAENAVAVGIARQNKMDLSLGIALGSSLQVALFVAPVLVFISLLFGHPMTLVFNEYELAAIVGGVIIATMVSLDGESNWLEGAQLLIVYIIVGLGFFFLT